MSHLDLGEERPLQVALDSAFLPLPCMGEESPWVDTFAFTSWSITASPADSEGPSSSTRTASIFSRRDVIFEKDKTGKTTKYVYAAGLRIVQIDCTPALFDPSRPPARRTTITGKPSAPRGR